jgi:TP901 family phage tail tape measure protein
MPKKALASLNVVINAVTSPLFRGLNKASKRLTVFGAKMKAVGRSITSSFSLPFAAIGAAGAKMAMDFEKNMTKINTLVGVSGKEVQKLAQDVMGLSGSVAQAPAELAEGLFFLSSAGLRGANAMQTLEAVSKGVAIGLGEQTDLAKVAAAAQNAYGEETISAAEALDVFAGAVKEGMFEASDLAQVLGQQLGMASSLGISFEEANAFIATYTKTTGDAKAASTSFGGVMMSLAKTTPQMEKALMKAGLSGNIVREMLGEQGLMKTLIHIKTAFEDNNVPLTQFFSKSQALKGVLGTLGEQTDTYASILDGLNNSSGNVNKGFSTLENTAGFQMQKAFNNLKLATQELGTVMMPIFQKIVEGAVKIAKGFTSLDSGTKKLTVAAGAVVALSGPLMTLAGGLVTALGMVLTPVGFVVVALGALFAVIYNNWGTTKTILVGIINYFIELYNESVLVRAVINSFVFAFKFVLAAAQLFANNLVDVFVAIKESFMGIIGGVGDIVMGILTFDEKKLKEGFEKATSGVGDTVKEVFKKVGENVEQFMEKVGTNAADAVEKTINAKPLKMITEDDIQKTVNDVEGWLSSKLKKVRDKIKGFLGGGIVLNPEKDEGKKEGEPEGGKELEKTLDEKIGKWQQYWNQVKAGASQLGQFMKDHYQDMLSAASMVINAIGSLWAAEHEKEMQIIENSQKIEQDAFDADYERELAALENANLTAAEREQAEADFKEKFAQRQQDIDDKFDEKRKNAEAKQARRQKQMAIANAIMGTAQGVIQAIALGPIIGPPLAMMMAGLGAAQLAVITSTPLPLAEGGLAFGPVNAIVGDNPGAANDPEVVAPLSKLQSMLSTNVNVNVEGDIKGDDIYLVNRNASVKRGRFI